MLFGWRVYAWEGQKFITATPDGESRVLLFSLGNGLLLGSGWTIHN